MNYIIKQIPTITKTVHSWNKTTAKILTTLQFFLNAFNTNSDSFGMISETISTYSQSIHKICQTKSPINALHSV